MPHPFLVISLTVLLKCCIENWSYWLNVNKHLAVVNTSLTKPPILPEARPGIIIQSTCSVHQLTQNKLFLHRGRNRLKISAEGLENKSFQMRSLQFLFSATKVIRAHSRSQIRIHFPLHRNSQIWLISPIIFKVNPGRYDWGKGFMRIIYSFAFFSITVLFTFLKVSPDNSQYYSRYL